MCPPGSAGRALIATKSGQTTMLSNKTKRRKRREPSKPLGGIRREFEQSLLGTDHDVLALCPIFNQWQNMRVLASIYGGRRQSRLLLQGFVPRRFQGFVLGTLPGLLLRRFQ